MSDSFEKMNRDVLSILAKYPMQALPDSEIDALLERYSDEELIPSLSYLRDQGMISSDVLYDNVEGTQIDFDSLKLTANGYNFATGNALGREINTVTIRLDTNTIQHLEDIINATNLNKKDKQTLRTKLKEKGAEHFLTKCIDFALTNSKTAGIILLEYLKNSN